MLPNDGNPGKNILQPKQTFLVIQNLSPFGSVGMSSGLTLIPCIAPIGGETRDISQVSMNPFHTNGMSANTNVGEITRTGFITQESGSLTTVPCQAANVTCGPLKIPQNTANSYNFVYKTENTTDQNTSNLICETGSSTINQAEAASQKQERSEIPNGGARLISQGTVNTPNLAGKTSTVVSGAESIPQNVLISTKPVSSATQETPQEVFSPCLTPDSVTPNITESVAGATTQNVINQPKKVQKTNNTNIRVIYKFVKTVAPEKPLPCRKRKVFSPCLTPDSVIPNITESVAGATTQNVINQPKKVQKTNNTNIRLIYKFVKTVAPEKPLPCRKRMAKLVKSLSKLADSENQSICLVCDINCKSSEGLLDHKKGNQFVCRICTLTFYDHQSLESHFICHNKYQCKLCDSIFLTKDKYLEHRNSKETCTKGTRKQCEFCGKVYSKPESLRYHVKHFHTEINYACIVCGRSFDKLYRLTDHEKIAHVAYENMECETCHKLLQGPEKLKIHVERIHVGKNEEQPIFCTICRKFFDTWFLLKAHIKTHDSTDYPCEVCGGTITGLEKFKRHMTDKHKQGPFQCNVCRDVFPTMGKLRFHKISHRQKKRKDKLFMCEVCGKHCKSQEELKKHQRIHSTDRPYQCDICGATFKQPSALFIHGRVHSDTKKYYCDNCGLGFNWKQTLEKHFTKCKNST